MTVSDIVVAELAVNSVIATPEVGEGPQAVVISPDGTRAYVANADGDSVTVLNTADHSTVGTITVGGSPGRARPGLDRFGALRGQRG